MLNHNIETVSRLYPRVRPGAQYHRSLAILEYAARRRLPVKSGLMLGLGETENEVMETLIDLKRTGCRYLTLGQYLSPSPDHVPVAHYLPPEEFDRWAETARHWDFQALPPVRWYEVLIAPMRCLQNRKGSPQSSQRTLRRP